MKRKTEDAEASRVLEEYTSGSSSAVAPVSDPGSASTAPALAPAPMALSEEVAQAQAASQAAVDAEDVNPSPRKRSRRATAQVDYVKLAAELDSESNPSKGNGAS